MTKKFILNNLSSFSMKQIVDSGQAFRWDEFGEGHFVGVIYDRIIELIQDKDKVTLINVDQADYDSFVRDYFDMDRDYDVIKDFLRGRDEHLDSAIDFGSGIRILNQDLWEMIITFIISGNNNIPRIKKSIFKISKKYGKYLGRVGENDYYSFPTPEELSRATIDDLRECGVGYRDKYIHKTTNMIINNEVDLDLVRNSDYKESKEILKKLTGIGDKVADCILLFSCKKINAFPVDTWVKKILTEYYGLKKTSIKDVEGFINEHFGKYSGIAQQYLFYYIRSIS